MLLSPYAAPEEVTLDSQQLATVRAALEWYVQCGLGDHALRPIDIAELATASGACDALADAGLARLQGLLDDAHRVKLRWPLRA
ncbi:hypothetical protein RHOFW510R12_00505 [Rhodanobacter sp. FW510-R12]